MSNESIAGAAIGGMVGSAAGPVGALAGGALGWLAGDAYSKKPIVGNFATTVQNDLAPEKVTLDAHQIYVRITTGHGRDTLVAAGEVAADLSTRFATERAGQIAKARSLAAGAWQGDASAAADAATAPLSDSFATAQEQLATNSQALGTAVAAFDHIRSQVEYVPPTPPHSDIANSVNPFQTDVDAAINSYNAKAAKNVQLYEAYSTDTAAARSQFPQSYAEPTPLNESAPATSRTGSPVGSTPTAPPQVGPPADAGQPAATNASAAPGGPSSAPPSNGGPSGMPSGTAGQGAAATDTTARQTPSPTAMTPGGVPAARDTYAGGPLTGQPRPTGMPDTQRKLTGAGPGIGGASGTRGINTGGGPGTSGGPGIRSGGPSVGTGPVPGQPSPGPGQPVGRGGPGGPAAHNAAGTPVGAAGRGNGEEDQKHRRKYLIQPDDKDLFGVDGQYAPPVIGDRR